MSLEIHYAEPQLSTTDGRILHLRTIYCIGRNYSEHAHEMNTQVPDNPIVFIKPPTAYIPTGGTIIIPQPGHIVHHEVELVALIGRYLHHATMDEARSAIVGYAVGVDVTLRDIQQYAKQHGLPWTLAKGFATSAPISPVVPSDELVDIDNTEFGITINGKLRQSATPGEMIWSVPELIVYVSRWFILMPGDAIFTGTPPGVGLLYDGDTVHAWLGRSTFLDVTVRTRTY